MFEALTEWAVRSPWLAVLAVPALPVLGVLGVRGARWLGWWMPRLWDDLSQLHYARYDPDGLLEAMVYAADEAFFQDLGRVPHLRRWERGRGIVWERRCARRSARTIVVAGGSALFTSVRGRLCAVDVVSGAAVWEMEPPLLDMHEPVVQGTRIFFDGRHPETSAAAWVEVDARDGSIAARGERFHGKEQRVRIEASLNDGEVRRIEGRLVVMGRPRPKDATCNFDVMLCHEVDGGFEHTLGPSRSGSVNVDLPFGRETPLVLRVGRIWHPKLDEAIHHTVIVDLERGRVLADIAQGSASYLTPDGRMSPIRV